MGKSNFAHDIANRKREKRRQLLIGRLKACGNQWLADVLGVCKSAITYKKKNFAFNYEELVRIFSDKRNFTDEEILQIMGRREIDV